MAGRRSLHAFAVARRASRREATEVVGNVALNTLTNFFNKVAQVDIDFPVVDPAHS